MKKIVTTAIAFAALLAFIVVPNKADAATLGETGWADWLMPSGQICLETNGWTIPAKVAYEWNKSDADVVGKASCAAYPRNMTVKYVGINKPSDVACAWTGSSDGWTRKTVRGMSILTPNAPTVWINYGASYNGCRRTTAMVLHVWMHEFGHVLGLAHNKDVSVLNGWTYNVPTYTDIRRVNYRY